MGRSGFAGVRTMNAGTYAFIVGEHGQAMNLRLAPGDECPAEGLCYNWGCPTPAARRLARAILWASVRDMETVKACQEAFLSDVVARLPIMRFTLHSCTVGDWLVAVTASVWKMGAVDHASRRNGGAK